MTKFAILFATASFTVGAAAFAATNEQPAQQAAPATQPAAKPVNTVCPVSGDPIDPTVTTTYQGKTVAFCCKDCIEDFQKNPDKYMKKLK
jgi:YHS domain-containing protein